MIELIIFILINYGLSYIISQAVIFEKIRNKITNEFLNNLINCNVCISFWTAMAIGIFLPISNIVFCGLIGIGSTLLIEKITKW